MKKLVPVLAAVAMATSAHAATVFDFSAAPHQDNLGPTETYTVDGLTIIASGFTAANAATNLWGKHAGGDENGLGLANDPSGDNEIHFGSGYVQLDVLGLFGQAIAAQTFFGTNSTTENEQWTVWGTNTAGSLAGATQVAQGTTEGNHLLPSLGTYRYYDFVSTAAVGGQNYLISSLTTTAVPEPAAWAMMLLGFGGLGAVLRRRRATARLAAA
jgi:hypothetical protein